MSLESKQRFHHGNPNEMGKKEKTNDFQLIFFEKNVFICDKWNGRWWAHR